MKHTVLLGVPSSGQISEGTSRASWLASLKHHVIREPSCNSGPNFNALWCSALNAGLEQRITHFAMIHADVTVHEDEEGVRWLDRLIEELDSVDGHFVSTPVAIKDHRGLTSSGVGNPENRWNPWRRFTVKELADLPTTFNKFGCGEAGRFLLHNHALCVWDMRKPEWYATADGAARCLFNFEERVYKLGDRFVRDQESEDWYFSRRLWEMGVDTYLSTRVKVDHHGGMSFGNFGDWGLWAKDEDTRSQWDEPATTGA